MPVDLNELTVVPDNFSTAVNPSEGELMYYRKPAFKPDGVTPLREAGWIVWGEANDKEMVRLMRNKGFYPLHQYGRFNHNEKGFSITQRGYYYILIHPSGPSEFPVHQIVELQWNVKPPYGLAVTFPQLQGVDIKDERCSLCGKGFWGLSQDVVTKKLRNHQRVQHREESQNERLAEVLSQAQKDMQGPQAELFAMLVEGQRQQAKVLEALSRRLLSNEEKKQPSPRV